MAVTLGHQSTLGQTTMTTPPFHGMKHGGSATNSNFVPLASSLSPTHTRTYVSSTLCGAPYHYVVGLKYNCIAEGVHTTIR